MNTLLSSSVGIIGGADGPTSIFIAGNVGNGSIIKSVVIVALVTVVIIAAVVMNKKK